MPYATPEQLATFLGLAAPPAGAQRLLDRASRDVDTALLTAVYDTDPDTGQATDPKVATALHEATLEQASWRMDTGDSAGGAGKWSTVKIGSAQLDRRTDRTPPQEEKVGDLGADAFKVLQRAGLTGHEPYSC